MFQTDNSSEYACGLISKIDNVIGKKRLRGSIHFRKDYSMEKNIT